MSEFGDWTDEDESHNDTTQIDDDVVGPTLVYGSVNEFFRDYLRNVYMRRINAQSHVWAAEWWRVDEAVVRLEALWRAWEYLRLDAATGMSVWFRDHADHHMNVLMAPEGPFAGAEDKTKRGEPLPHTEPPDGLFPDVRD